MPRSLFGSIEATYSAQVYVPASQMTLPRDHMYVGLSKDLERRTGEHEDTDRRPIYHCLFMRLLTMMTLKFITRHWQSALELARASWRLLNALLSPHLGSALLHCSYLDLTATPASASQPLWPLLVSFEMRVLLSNVFVRPITWLLGFGQHYSATLMPRQLRSLMVVDFNPSEYDFDNTTRMKSLKDIFNSL